jgi:hypothetical protein
MPSPKHISFIPLFASIGAFFLPSPLKSTSWPTYELAIFPLHPIPYFYIQSYFFKTMSPPFTTNIKAVLASLVTDFICPYYGKSNSEPVSRYLASSLLTAEWGTGWSPRLFCIEICCNDPERLLQKLINNSWKNKFMLKRSTPFIVFLVKFPIRMMCHMTPSVLKGFPPHIY